jgi:hypothetical protein
VRWEAVPWEQPLEQCPSMKKRRSLARLPEKPASYFAPSHWTEEVIPAQLWP